MMEEIRQIDLKVNARKTDKSNKIVHWLYANYDFVYFQDEQLASWQRCRRRGYVRSVENHLSVPCLQGTSIADPLKRKEAHTL